MEITVAKSAGFCFGVKRAIKIAFDAANTNKHVEMLGDIVHNEDVVKHIEAAGIQKVANLTSGKNKILLIRAHGSSHSTIKRAIGHGYTLVDATCSMVKEIHKIAEKMEQKGYSIIIIGDKKHEEVKGIKGHIKSKALVIDSPEHIPLDELKKIKRAAIVVQSTQTQENAEMILEVLKSLVKDVQFFNTICRPTQTKQKEIKILPLKNDIVIIIGSKTSANTKRLYEISKSLNSRSYWIQSKEDLNSRWFEGVGKVGITAGASTPEDTIKKVVSYIKYLSDRDKTTNKR